MAAAAPVSRYSPSPAGELAPRINDLPKQSLPLSKGQQAYLDETLFSRGGPTIDLFEFQGQGFTKTISLRKLILNFICKEGVTLRNLRLTGSALRSILHKQLQNEGDIDFLGLIDLRDKHDPKDKLQIMNRFLEALFETLEIRKRDCVDGCGKEMTEYTLDGQIVAQLPRRADFFRDQRILKSIVPVKGFPQDLPFFFVTLPLFKDGVARDVDLRFTFETEEMTSLSSLDCFECDVLPRIQGFEAPLTVVGSRGYDSPQKAWDLLEAGRFWIENIGQLSHALRGYAKHTTKGYRPISQEVEKQLLMQWQREVGERWEENLEEYFNQLGRFIFRHMENDSPSVLAYLTNLRTIFLSNDLSPIPQKRFISLFDTLAAKLLSPHVYNFSLLRCAQFWTSAPVSPLNEKGRYLIQCGRKTYLWTPPPFRETLQLLTLEDDALRAHLNAENPMLELPPTPQAFRAAISESLLAKEGTPHCRILGALAAEKIDPVQFGSAFIDMLPYLDEQEWRWLLDILKNRDPDLHHFMLDLPNLSEKRLREMRIDPSEAEIRSLYPQLLCSRYPNSPELVRKAALAAETDASLALAVESVARGPILARLERKIMRNPDANKNGLHALICLRVPLEETTLKQALDRIALNEFSSAQLLSLFPWGDRTLEILSRLSQIDVESFFDGWERISKQGILPHSAMEPIARALVKTSNRAKIKRFQNLGLKHPDLYREALLALVHTTQPLEERTLVYLAQSGVGTEDFWKIQLNRRSADLYISLLKYRNMVSFLPRMFSELKNNTEAFFDLWRGAARELGSSGRETLIDSLRSLDPPQIELHEEEIWAFLQLADPLKFKRRDAVLVQLLKQDPSQNLWKECIAIMEAEPERRWPILQNIVSLCRLLHPDHFVASLELGNGVASCAEQIVRDRETLRSLFSHFSLRKEFCHAFPKEALVSYINEKGTSSDRLEDLYCLETRYTLVQKAIASPNARLIEFLLGQDLPKECSEALIRAAMIRQFHFIKLEFSKYLGMLTPGQAENHRAIAQYLNQSKFPLEFLESLPLPPAVLWNGVQSQEVGEQIRFFGHLLRKENREPMPEIERYWVETLPRLSKIERLPHILELRTFRPTSDDFQNRLNELLTNSLETFGQLQGLAEGTEFPAPFVTQALALAKEQKAEAGNVARFLEIVHGKMATPEFLKAMKEWALLDQEIFQRALHARCENPAPKEIPLLLKWIVSLKPEQRQRLYHHLHYVNNCNKADLMDPQLFPMAKLLVSLGASAQDRPAVTQILLEKMSRIEDPVKALEAMDQIIHLYDPSKEFVFPNLEPIFERLPTNDPEGRKSTLAIRQKIVDNLEQWLKVVPPASSAYFLKQLIQLLLKSLSFRDTAYLFGPGSFGTLAKIFEKWERVAARGETIESLRQIFNAYRHCPFAGEGERKACCEDLAINIAFTQWNIRTIPDLLTLFSEIPDCFRCLDIITDKLHLLVLNALKPLSLPQNETQLENILSVCNSTLPILQESTGATESLHTSSILLKFAKILRELNRLKARAVDQATNKWIEFLISKRLRCCDTKQVIDIVKACSSACLDSKIRREIESKVPALIKALLNPSTQVPGQGNDQAIRQQIQTMWNSRAAAPASEIKEKPSNS